MKKHKNVIINLEIVSHKINDIKENQYMNSTNNTERIIHTIMEISTRIIRKIKC